MSNATLLKEISKLPYALLDKLVPRIVTLRARKHPLAPPARESRLVEKITRGVPPDLQAEYRSLIEKRRAHGLTAREQQRCIEVADALEAFSVQWLRWLIQLARLRGQTLDEARASLRLPEKPYV